MSAVRLRCALIACLLGCSSGCSWIFVERPPARPARYFSCTTSRWVPAFDTFLGLAGVTTLAGYLIVASQPDERDPPFDALQKPEVFSVMIGAAVVAALGGLSAYRGFRTVERCRSALHTTGTGGLP